MTAPRPTGRGTDRLVDQERRVDRLEALVRRAFDDRVGPVEALAADAERVAAVCRDVAVRVHGGGRVLAFGNGRCAADARHIAVEFVHPVIVGKRSLPALCLADASAALTGAARRRTFDEAFVERLATFGEPGDVALGLSPDGRCANVARALEHARSAGLLTVALTGGDGGPIARNGLADHVFAIPSSDPLVVEEAHVSLYHLLWELVHVFLESPGLLEQVEAGALPPPDEPVAGPPPTGDQGVERLYPFLYAGESDVAATMAEVRRSVEEKIADVVALRRLMAGADGARMARCAVDLAEALGAGATAFTFGNGGSSTDADDLAETLSETGGGPGGRCLRSMSLVSDVATLTALANDVGFDVVFARQLAGLARPGDVAIGISTSGNSPNLVRAFDEARRAGLLTVGLAGGDGGDMASAGTIDHLFVVPSSSVHRIQEVQATVYHVLARTVGDLLSS